MCPNARTALAMAVDMTETFHAHLVWTGSAKGGTHDPAALSRDLELTLAEHMLPMSSAPGFSGDPARMNPEQLLVGAVSACQALTFLALAARKQVAVVGYEDDAEGTLEMVDGKLRISRVVLRPRIALEGVPDDAGAADMLSRVRVLVDRAHQACFIANSVLARIDIEPVMHFEEASARA